MKAIMKAVVVALLAVFAFPSVSQAAQAVREDSRCPTDVQCVWAGDAKIELTISRSGAADEVKVISLTPPDNETPSGDLRIRFTGLAPVPRQADSGKPPDYVARLVVTQS